MKRARLWLTAGVLALSAGFITTTALRAEVAQSRHLIVFELTSKDPAAWDALLNNVDNVREALGSSAIQVVTHGEGIEMLIASTNARGRERLERAARQGVVLSVCRNSMRKRSVAEKQLLAVATTVDSGVAEVVRKQEVGWSYVRSGP